MTTIEAEGLRRDVRRNPSQLQDPKAFARVALALAPPNFLGNLRARHADNGVAAAVLGHDTSALYTWMTTLVRLQGVSDRAADTFAATRHAVTSADIGANIGSASACRRLRSFWHFSGCAYRKNAQTCAEPRLLAACPLPRLDLRKGGLNVAAYGLALFFRDVADNDFVAWLDGRLEKADYDADSANRSRRLRDAVLLPFAEVAGVGRKLAGMILADLLLGADPSRERWVAAGGAMVAVDTLVHATLARSGIMDQLGRRHAVGAACYQANGCASVIERLAADLSAEYERIGIPKVLARQLQHAIWHLAAEGGADICNGRRINDAVGCRQRLCPASARCARLPLRSKIDASDAGEVDDEIRAEHR